MNGIEDRYAQYVRPYVGKVIKLLKLDKVYFSGRGDFLSYRTDPENSSSPVIEVLDLLGGYGSTLLGHNHPEIIQAMKDQLETGVAVHAQLSIRAQTASLAKKLSESLSREIKGSESWITTLANSGAEAAECAIKHALMDWNSRKQKTAYLLKSARLVEVAETVEQTAPVIISLEGSFHGKTGSAVSISSNPYFKAMYSSGPCEIHFLNLSWTAEEIQNFFEKFELPLKEGKWSRIAAVFYEPIQGEGGIRVLPPNIIEGLKKLARESHVPLVADEIQSGLYRTGNFLASPAMGIEPDYVLLGKGLGGGIAKIASFSVKRTRYVESFGLIHSSTFAEDDLSSAIALKTLEVLEAQASEIRERSTRFENLVKSRIGAISNRFPGVIKEVRGLGFMLGIEFNYTADAPLSTFMATIFQAGFATYIFSSYLLEKHRVRVGVTLSKPDTIRIEPSAWIDDVQIDRFLGAFEDLVKIVSERKLVQLTSHFWRQDFTAADLEIISPRQPAAIAGAEGLRQIAFFVHLINDPHLCLFDPVLRALTREERDRFQTKFGPIAGPVRFHDQVVTGENGEKILLVCYGVFLPTTFFEMSLRSADGEAFRQTEAMVSRAIREGADLAGLGQYTSIVSDNGLMFQRYPVKLTTGNSLTAGFAFQALEKALREKGKSLSDAKVGVVGAAGNICNVLTQLIADHAKALTLIFREDPTQDPKAIRAIKMIVDNSVISPTMIQSSTDLGLLADCDAIMIGTNTSRQLLLPEHCKENAVVLDISVPSNISPRVFKERKDVKCFQGGMAKLPLQQSLSSPWFPVPQGEVFACMGETICAGLVNYPTHVSIGQLSKARVLEVLEIAKKVGMTVGSLRGFIRE
jgi:acetylornithine/succinyldiaminopimelate/putrescine aminotransferase/predicted amino acid dehydrogenase